MANYPLFHLGNYLYKYAFRLYFPLYFVYKIVSDKTERNLMKMFVHPGDCVFDIGANIGIYSVYLSRLVGNTGVVHAFEPDVTNFLRLTQHTRLLQNVRIHQQAVGNFTGPIALYVSEDLNVDHRTYPSDSSRKVRQIACIRLDEYFQGQKVDFIKMDIQGYEYEALQGMRRLLQQNPQIKLIMEFWPYGLRLAGSSPSAVLQLLEECNFHVYLIDKSQLKPYRQATIAQGEKDYYNLFMIKEPLTLESCMKT